MSREVQLAPIGDLQYDDQNARHHPEDQIDLIIELVSRFGQTRPLVVWNGVVMAGNALLKALREMGRDEAFVLDVSDLTDEEARALALSDNRVAELSDWDNDALNSIFSSLLDQATSEDFDDEILNLTGFTLIEMDQHMSLFGQDDDGDSDSEEDGDGGEEADKSADLKKNTVSGEESADPAESKDDDENEVGDSDISKISLVGTSVEIETLMEAVEEFKARSGDCSTLSALLNIVNEWMTMKDKR